MATSDSDTARVSTAAAENDKISVSKLDCSICLSRFKDPKLLTCFHTFCLECLEEYVMRNGKHDKFECPLCRTSMELPAGGVKTFQSNFYIEMGSLPETNVDCDGCGNGQVSSHYCIDCEEHFCERCALPHSKMKMTREHKMVQLLDTVTAESVTRKVQKKAYCPHHNGEEIKMTCKDCNELLCVVCKLTEHENHCTAGIAKEAEERRKLLSQKVAETQSTVEGLKLTIGKVQNCADGIQSKLESDVKEIDKHVEQIVKQIKDDSEKMKQDVRASCTEALGYYVEQKKMLLERVSEGDAVVTHAQNVVDVGDDINVLDMNLLTKLNSMKSAEENSSVKNMTHLTFKASNYTNAQFQIGRNIKTKHDLSVHEERTIGTESVGNTTQANVLAVSAENLFGGFFDFECLLKYNIGSQTCETFEPLTETIGDARLSGLIVPASDLCYFSHLPSKSVYQLVGKQSGKKFCKFRNYPFGIAFRNADKACFKEVLVCVLDTATDTRTSEFCPTSGCVMAVPVNTEEDRYIWRVKETPGPACITVNEVSGQVCLGYPAARKVTLNSPNGTVLSEFRGDMDFGSPETFSPNGVCFDRDEGIIIADYGNDAVIRIDENGNYLQCLVKGGKPLSLALGTNCMLYVGFMDRDITQYSLKSEDTL